MRKITLVATLVLLTPTWLACQRSQKQTLETAPGAGSTAADGSDGSFATDDIFSTGSDSGLDTDSTDSNSGLDTDLFGDDPFADTSSGSSDDDPFADLFDDSQSETDASSLFDGLVDTSTSDITGTTTDQSTGTLTGTTNDLAGIQQALDTYGKDYLLADLYARALSQRSEVDQMVSDMFAKLDSGGGTDASDNPFASLVSE